MAPRHCLEIFLALLSPQKEHTKVPPYATGSVQGCLLQLLASGGDTGPSQIGNSMRTVVISLYHQLN